MLEHYEPIEPPEIREVEERYRIIEFYVDLGEARPDIKLMELVTEWLRSNSPVPLGGLDIAYRRPTEQEPSLLVGILHVGEPIDVG